MIDVDLSFLEYVQDGRSLEVEAVEGGRQSNLFNFAPAAGGDDEESTVMLRSADGVGQTDDRLELIPRFLSHAREAYSQRGLVYPFQATAAHDAFEVVPGQGELAARSAALSRIVGFTQPTAKEFETRAFKALHELIGGWGVCVGTPRQNGRGPEASVAEFRNRLADWEKGTEGRDDYPPNGDLGADGFIILGRSWGGPIVFFQAKNSDYDLKTYPDELARMPEILHDWFGKRWNHHRQIIPVLAANTVLTLGMKDRIYLGRGGNGAQLIDAVDIVAVEFTAPAEKQQWNLCQVL